MSATTEFFDVVGSALWSMSKEHVRGLYQSVETQNAITISYDRQAHPFLLYKPELGKPSSKVSIPGDSHVLSEIKSHLWGETEDFHGGDAYLANARAFRMSDNHTLVTCEWMWLGRPMIGSMLSMMSEILADRN